MGSRWTLSRAGITNVYQYADEVLRFGGGRLLLRGVNGSGKSTAMNMLLPFLLDADVRRIDAAGEQAGVLRSWMLSGRDETQPTGYLWLEVAREHDHLVFGCGIKANHNTDNVNHWWFITDRRPGIDLELVRTQGRARTPLSIEELRSELGPGHVWPKDQRAGYRTALRDALYGGADLDQHLRLLHIVRNPRVGDRVDVELPQHLHDALPQLSETAIDDAATPLEQLEEHRRNVAQLTDTAGALDALVASYRDHVRGEVRERAETARTSADAHRHADREVATAEARREAADAEVSRLTEKAENLADDERRITTEIQSLEASDAFKAAADLDQRRRHVAALLDKAGASAAEHDRQRERADAAAADVASEGRDTEDVSARLAGDVEVLAATALTARLDVAGADVPLVATGPQVVDDDAVVVPVGPYDAAGLRDHVSLVRQRAQVRSAEVDEVLALLERVTEAERALADAEERLVEARAAELRARDAESDASAARADAVDRWRESAERWREGLDAHRATTGLATAVLTIEPVDGDPFDVEPTHAALIAAVDDARRAHDLSAATLSARLADEEQAVHDAQAVVDELAAREVPDPPSAPWQVERRGRSLAELVDFAAHLDDDDRRGLEAALEASGLLAAEVRPDGSLATGDLVVGASAPVDHPLGDLLTEMDEPGGAAPGGPAPGDLAAVLAGISTSPADLDDATVKAVVTADGRFRLGPLRGSHAKEVAEHIGVTARRAALARQREVAAATLAHTTAAVEATRREVEVVATHQADADRLRADVPATTAVVAAGARVDAARQRHAEAEEAVERRTRQRDEADSHHAERSDLARRTCAGYRLPAVPAELGVVRQACRELASLADGVERSTRAVVAAVERWTTTGDRWARARHDSAEAATRAARDAEEHQREQAALATLEDAIGLDSAELLATLERTRAEHGTVVDELQAVRARQGPAAASAGAAAAGIDRAIEAREGEVRRCLAALHRLRALEGVPGLLTAAFGETPEPPDGPDAPQGAVDGDSDGDGASHPATVLPVVEASPAGLRVLARSLLELVPVPAQAVAADGVRIALRQRRATLGAGWDAVDSQPDADLPLAVEVNGPLGRMPLVDAALRARDELETKQGLLSAQQDQALQNLLQGLIAKEVAEKLHAARELVERMNDRLRSIRTTHGIGVSLRWKKADDLGEDLTAMVELLARPPDLRTPDDDERLVAALSARLAEARRADPEADYRSLIATVLDYRDWHRMQVVVHRPGVADAVLSRRTPLSEGEKKIVSYQPLFAAVAASCDALAERASDAPRFVLLDDAFAKVSEDNHPKLFGLLVDLDLDFIATSERLWGTHATVPELAITEVVRDAEAGVIVLEHAHWDGRTRSEVR